MNRFLQWVKDLIELDLRNLCANDFVASNDVSLDCDGSTADVDSAAADGISLVVHFDSFLKAQCGMSRLNLAADLARSSGQSCGARVTGEGSTCWCCGGNESQALMEESHVELLRAQSLPSTVTEAPSRKLIIGGWTADVPTRQCG
jgi:hypothetical protein